MKLRFQADADLARITVPERRAPDVGRGPETSIDWRPAGGFIPDGTPDPAVLKLAADADRVLVSRDIRTMPVHFASFVKQHRSPGVILIPVGVPIGEAIERLLVAWLSWTPQDLENQIRWLPDR